MCTSNPIHSSVLLQKSHAPSVPGSRACHTLTSVRATFSPCTISTIHSKVLCILLHLRPAACSELTWTRLRDQSSLSPADSCLSRARAVASGMRFCLRMNLARSPPAQYSMTRNILPFSCAHARGIRSDSNGTTCHCNSLGHGNLRHTH